MRRRHGAPHGLGLQSTVVPDLNFVRYVGPVRWLARTLERQIYKRILRRDQHLQLPTGLRITLPRTSKFGSEVLLTRANVDLGAEALLAEFAAESRDTLDIGAHIGYYSLYLAPVSRFVAAFEPDPRNLAVLRLNAAVAENVEVVPLIVSDRVGMRHFEPGISGETSRVALTGGDLKVPAVTVDAFVESRALDPAVIKIDVEGHDLAVIRGAENTLRRHNPLVLTEFSGEHDRRNELEELHALCCKLGYQIFGFVHRAAWAGGVELRRVDTGHATEAKMLFLVPRPLAAAFARREACTTLRRVTDQC